MSIEAANDTIPDYKNMQPGDFLQAIGMDSKKWTDAFMQIAPDATDEATMIGWFANAIMAGWDRGVEHGLKCAALPDGGA